jgi:hypothetical protein
MENAEVCIANIGPRGRRQRAWFGVVALGLSLAGAGALLALGVARPWRLALFLPLFAAGTGIFQAKEKT